jgi:hypothetical protein
MPMGNTAQSDLLKLLFQNVTWANLGDATGVVGSTGAGSLYIALHTANPGASGSQTTSEAAYGGYARQAVARNSGGWTISGTSPTQAANAAAVTFPAATNAGTTASGGTETETYFSIGRASSGAGEILISGALSSSLVVALGITPSFVIGALVATCD